MTKMAMSDWITCHRKNCDQPEDIDQRYEKEAAKIHQIKHLDMVTLLLQRSRKLDLDIKTCGFRNALANLAKHDLMQPASCKKTTNLF
jgi:hypothetical protein